MRRFACLLLAVTMALPLCASAQGQNPPPPARAQELFDQGVSDMIAGRFDSACSALAESFRLEPGAGVEFTLAECHAKWGKLLAALTHYRGYLERVAAMTPEQRKRHDERATIANQQVASLGVRVPMLTLIVPAELPAGTKVTLDGKPVEPEAFGVEQPVEAGEHRIVLEAPGREAVVKQEVLREGQRRVVLLQMPSKRPTSPPPPEPTPAPDGDPQRVWAYAVGGVGLAGLLLGAITGGAAMSETSTVDDNCVDLMCNQEGLDAADTGSTLAAVSTVGFVVGGVGLVAATVLWLTAPSPDEDQAAWQIVVGGEVGRAAGGELGVRVRW